jgi:hypothetical protein
MGDGMNIHPLGRSSKENLHTVLQAAVVVVAIILVATMLMVTLKTDNQMSERKAWCKAVHSEAELYIKCLDEGVKTLDE